MDNRTKNERILGLSDQDWVNDILRRNQNKLLSLLPENRKYKARGFKDYLICQKGGMQATLRAIEDKYEIAYESALHVTEKHICEEKEVAEFLKRVFDRKKLELL